ILESDPDVPTPVHGRVDEASEIDAEAGDHPWNKTSRALQKIEMGFECDPGGRKPPSEGVGKHEAVYRRLQPSEPPGQGCAEPRKPRLVDRIARPQAVRLGELETAQDVVFRIQVDETVGFAIREIDRRELAAARINNRDVDNSSLCQRLDMR